ncbi:tetratricopeptide repeat protein [Balneola sp. MJW-20]|uniref:tetratricopeptide repeat protein n=1 Tax=Gracilimonas aurantiaca TaxID=3234185 RepID=UPI003465F759
MKYSLLTRLTGLLLVAGFLHSCASSRVNLDNLIENDRYQEALAEIDARLDDDPAQPSLYIQKGEILAEQAQNSPVMERGSLYDQTIQAFDQAASYEATDAQMSTIDDLKQQYWELEHNAGMDAFEQQGMNNRYQTAIAHFQNAISIKDDEMQCYRNLAIAQYKIGEVDAAIDNLNIAKGLADEVPTEIFEHLGFLYLEKGNTEQAIYYYTLANEKVENNLNLAFGLTNAYIAAGQHEKAAEILEGLVERYPQNADIRNVYGTQLYEITAGIMEDLKTAYMDRDTTLAGQIRFEAEGMGDSAEDQLISAYKRDTLKTDYIESLAVFYNNMAGQYFSALDAAFETDQDYLLDKALSLIDFAVEYYEKLIDMDPQNREYQSKLNILQNLKENRSNPN